MKMYHRTNLLSLALIVWTLAVSSTFGQEIAPCKCQRDLAAVAALLELHYAGYAHAEQTLGKRLPVALSVARKSADGATEADCDAAIRGFLVVFEDGHLLLSSQFSPLVDMPPPLFQNDREPAARPLSDQAFLFRVPSFAVGFKEDVESLLEEHRKAISGREILIVDVRGNTGGGDSTWTELITPIYSGPMKRWGIRWRPSGDNARAIEEQVEQLRKSSHASAAICDGMQQIANGMRENLDKDLVRLGPPLGPVVTLPEVWPSPRRVAIIIDGSCASSCENFLLAARQSSKVTVFGANTYGAIDFQNMRVAMLPSEDRQLRFAMSISDRVLTLGQRQKGLSPDHELTPEILRSPQAAIEQVMRQLPAKISNE